MELIKSKLILTDEEKDNLKKTLILLNAIAEKMDRAISVDWCFYDDDEIFGACEIIEYFIES